MSPSSSVFRAFASSAVLLLLGGCATTRVCNRVSASQLGQSDARSWDAGRANLRQAGSCTADYSSDQFARDYNDGFRQALGAQCSQEAAAAGGREAASRSEQWQLDSSRLELCAETSASVADLRSAYEQAYTATWCSASHGRALGRQHGEGLQRETLDWLANCPAESRDELTASYSAQHAESIATACSPPRMASWGVTLARGSGDLAQALATVAACPESLQHEAVTSLQRSYDTELRRLAAVRDEQRREQEAQRREQEAQRRALEHAQREEHRRVSASVREHVVKGSRVVLTCSVEGGRARVVLLNQGSTHLFVSTDMTVETYDAAGRPVDSSRSLALFSLSPGGMDDEIV